MRLVFQAGFDRYSGYGNDAIDMVVALDRIGVDVLPLPLSLLPGIPREFSRLLEKSPMGPKDVLVRMAPPFDLKPWEMKKNGVPAVGYTMWERLPMVVDDFVNADWAKYENRERVPQDVSFAGLAGLIVTCPMNVEALAPFADGVQTAVVPCGIEADRWPVLRRSTTDRMKFLYAGMLNGRKDPWVLLDAWDELKKERPDFDAQLHLHTLAPGLHPKIMERYPDVILTERPLPPEKVVDLYHGAHAYVCTSRGEGNNKPAMEFMAFGGTVLATDWSGHQNWLHPDATYPLPGKLEPAASAPEGVLEFRVDKEALKRQLLYCWSHREEVAKKGEIAASFIRSSHSWEHVAQRFAQTVGRMIGDWRG